ncbi:DUF2059 domain-containing protein [Flavobacterium terrigena]|uniref:DUF2059 domain-containing protein n=1 Tax=Flavobacterium terrigena TaxID=402734 RepID=A0A1H6V0Z3_9FLAO|nr:DUF2059 domain-containing protein [Flavobacterium terrigena]SEI94310.1 hypothetical protein SAMN05660918_1995 [Flavobacterium terrigena]
MKKTTILLFICFVISSHAQNDKTSVPIFEKIALEMKEFKLDTTLVPNDKLSKRIEKLRSLKGGFNINEAIEFKIAEERSKENAPTEELDKIEAFFKTGNGKKWLNNAIIWIYRKQFTLKEINQLIRFYKSSAGQKMAEKFPILMLQSLKAGEEIKENFVQQLKK